MTEGGVAAAGRSLGAALILASWLGAAVFMAAVVAPAAFAALPTRTLAGALVGRALPVLFVAGIIAGGAAAFLRRESRSGLALALAVAAACAVAQFGVAPRIEALRRELAVPLESLPPGDARRAEFGRLHGLSVIWLGVGMLAAGAGIAAATWGLRLAARAS
ncbi:MAG TPA: DUF4149 domain-containing protein [Gemmatimonadaceae bacterium]|nr:DUF4149 domain-containing protein [Gemmatimonadaceae bacterium]